MKLAVISGASSGVGKAASELFVRHGYTVVMIARSADVLADIASRMGNNAIAMQGNAADAQSVDEIAGRVLDEYGVPDVVINCAGAGQWKRIEDTPADEAALMMDAPYFAAFNLTRAFLPAMVSRNSGVIMHVNSPAAFAVWPNAVGYTAARWALRGLHEALAQDIFGTGVHSCHVVFGSVSSNYFENNPGVLEHFPKIDRILPRLTPEQCAEHLLRIAHRPRRQAFYPLQLRLLLWCQPVAPWLTRWLLRR